MIYDYIKPANEHRTFTIRLTDEVGFHSGRPRYFVQCECGKILHESTTGPLQNIERHVRNPDEP
jgi:hypothetical protein